MGRLTDIIKKYPNYIRYPFLNSAGAPRKGMVSLMIMSQVIGGYLNVKAKEMGLLNNSQTVEIDIPSYENGMRLDFFLEIAGLTGKFTAFMDPNASDDWDIRDAVVPPPAPGRTAQMFSTKYNRLRIDARRYIEGEPVKNIWNCTLVVNTLTPIIEEDYIIKVPTEEINKLPKYYTVSMVVYGDLAPAKRYNLRENSEIRRHANYAKGIFAYADIIVVDERTLVKDMVKEAIDVSYQDLAAISSSWLEEDAHTEDDYNQTDLEGNKIKRTDLNGDGITNLIDFAILVKYWHSVRDFKKYAELVNSIGGTGYFDNDHFVFPRWDLNQDGIVDNNDLHQFCENWLDIKSLQEANQGI